MTKKVKMVALRKFPYARLVLEVGEPFEADSEQDANVLVVVGHARRAENGASDRKYRRRDMRAEP